MKNLIILTLCGVVLIFNSGFACGAFSSQVLESIHDEIAYKDQLADCKARGGAYNKYENGCHVDLTDEECEEQGGWVKTYLFGNTACFLPVEI